MILTHKRSKRRRALTLVETAFVMIPLTMLIFGIFVYGQLLMDWNLLINAAQTGCRYALANNTSSTISSDVLSAVNAYLAGKSTSLTNVSISVSGTHRGNYYVGNSVSNLAPGDPITVTVTTTYQIPNVIPMVAMPSTINLSSSSTMICEGGN
jgi:Flp pilus assembly protein TadG